MRPPTRPGGSGILTSRISRRMISMLVLCALLPLASFASLALLRMSKHLDQGIREDLKRAAKDTGMILAGRIHDLFEELDLVHVALRDSGPAQDLETSRFGAKLCQGFQSVYLFDEGGICENLYGRPTVTPAPLSMQEQRHLATGNPLLRISMLPDLAPLFTLLRRSEADRFLAAEARSGPLLDPEMLRVRGSEVVLFSGDGGFLSGSAGKPEDTEEFFASLRKNPTSGTGAFRLAGKPQLMHYWRLFLIPRFGVDLLLAQSLPRSVALEPLHRFQALFAWITAATLLLVAGVGLVQIRRTLTPIALLKAATDQVAAGDLRVTVPALGGDELGDLACSFNSMTHQLRESIELRDAIEKQLVEARDEALAAAAAKSDFLTNVSHELRTPLTSILVFTELLADPSIDDPDQRAEFLGIVSEQAGLLGRLIDNILDLALPGQWDLDSVAVGQGLEAALDTIPASQRQRISLQLPADLPRVHGAQERLVQLWTYLLDNAVKYSPKGTLIEVVAESSGPFVAIAITDHGAGIAPSDLSHIFEPFQQVGRDIMTNKAPGVGLGLSLAKNIVDRCGGRIEVESVPGAGSTFRVLLPAFAPQSRQVNLCLPSQASFSA